MTAAVGAITAAMLALEVLLLRAFAIQYFHHVAWAVIAIAMLGGGASGTLLLVARDATRGRERPLFAWAAGTFAVLLAAAPWLALRLPFEPAELAWRAGAWGTLLGLYVVLALPFAAGTAAVILAMQAEPARTPALYGANLAGSGAGALLGVLLFFLPAPWTLRVTPFKALPQVEAHPGAVRLAERWSPLGWLVAVETPAFHHAPGLSLGFRGAVPPQVAIFVDGEMVGAATRWRADPAGAAFVRHLPSAIAWQLEGRRRVLVLGAGPGLEVLAALAHGADRVVAVELDRRMIALSGSLLDARSDVYRDPRVEVVIGDARSFAARSREQFDLVVVAPGDPFGATAAGVHALAEDYLTTVGALRAYLRLLAPGGVLSVTRWVRTPPRDNVRMILTAGAALRAAGDTAPGAHLAFFRNWAAGTLLVRPAGFTTGEAAHLRAAAATRLLDTDWLGAPPPVGQADVNLLERPVYREAAAAVAAGPVSAGAFAASYAFDVRPATDDRPYFSHFLRLGLLSRLVTLGAPSWLPFAEWGYVAVLATLLLGAPAAVVMLLPAALAVRRSTDIPLARIAAYFGAIGLGYLLVEMAFIQTLQRLLGHPVYAVSAALAAFLVCSGAGSWWSARLAPSWKPAGVVALIVAAELALAPAVVNGAQGLALPSRLLLALVLMAPLAAAMGAPFPTGARLLVGARPGALAWAWAANGFASVIASSLAMLLAIEFGWRWVLLGGGACYAGAALAAGRGDGDRAARIV